MKTLEKLQRYHNALLEWKEWAVHAPNLLDRKEPTPEQYGLKTESELFMARKMAREVEQKVTKETKLK